MYENEKKFWSDMDGIFPELVKQMASLAKKSYYSITNLKSGITWWSESTLEYFGLEQNYTAIGKEKTKRELHPDDVETFKYCFGRRVEGNDLDKSWEYRVKDGDKYNRFNAMSRMISDNEGKPLLLITRFVNYGLSDEVDTVTGLRTEAVLTRQLNEYISEGRRGALLKVNLDQFSHISVMYGAAFGDKVLNCVAQLLINILHDNSNIYKLSGVKFVLALGDIPRKKLREIYEKIEDAMENNVEVEGKKIPLRISAGAVYIEPYMTDSNAVRSRLTYAVNHSRYEHHGELVIFNDEMGGKDNQHQFELIALIHQCATSDFDGFKLFYQPIADTKNGTIRGMEALIRWEKEPYGIISPGIFMEWLEEDPCIFDLGNWILRTALNDIKKVRDELPGCFVNVNVSAAQLERREFRQSVMNILSETGARPEELCLELTERCRDLDVEFLKGEVDFFHSKGIKIALDDFGTGNSSLSLALELPFDELKVDMSFIRDIKDKPQNQAMVQSIIDYAKRTKTETCIEGIENREVDDYIKKFGATWHQGYYYSKPVPIESIEKLIRK
jgi:diguanylate cyclase (GGDEF)-like protein